MGQFASRKKAATISGHDKAILDLKIQRDKLKKYQLNIQVVLDRETQIAKTHLAGGDKKRAILVLKKKKYQEQLLDQTETQIMNVEEMVNSIEFALVEQKVIEGLKAGNEVLTRLNNEMKLENVEKLMEDTQDAIAYQQEINDLLRGSLSEADDKDIQDELDRMLAQEVSIPGIVPEVVDTNIELPSVPTVEPDMKQPQPEEHAKQEEREAIPL